MFTSLSCFAMCGHDLIVLGTRLPMPRLTQCIALPSHALSVRYVQLRSSLQPEITHPILALLYQDLMRGAQTSKVAQAMLQQVKC